MDIAIRLIYNDNPHYLYLYIRHTSSSMCVGYSTRPLVGLALKGRYKQRSNLPLADL